MYFMPQDGYGARQYLEDGIENRIRALEEEGDIPEMICVFPELRAGKPLEDQIREAIAVVEDHCPAGRGASMRARTKVSKKKPRPGTTTSPQARAFPSTNAQTTEAIYVSATLTTQRRSTMRKMPAPEVCSGTF